MEDLPDRLMLGLRFDAAAMAADAARLPADAWVPHFNQTIYEGDWSGVALRAPVGGGVALYSDPTVSPDGFADTPALEACPAVAAALATFRCPVTSARLLRLGPGATIGEHRDHRLSAADGEVRLHVAVATDERSEFFLDGRPVELRPGDCWYMNLSLPHRAANHGQTPRIHLVVDCVVDWWLSGELRDAAAAARSSRVV